MLCFVDADPTQLLVIIELRLGFFFSSLCMCVPAGREGGGGGGGLKMSGFI